jgi:hypothetical protein
MEVSGWLHAPAALLTGETVQVPIGRLGDYQILPGEEKNPAFFKTRTPSTRLSSPGVANCFGSGATLWKRRLAEGRTF